ncbi:MAG: sugar phosphate isomerase/epimerase family protein [Armatimonadota bacterium]
MKKGISVWAYDPKRPLPEVFRMAKEAGFDGVEVAIADDGPITPASTEADCKRIIEQAGEAGVALTSLASGLGWKYPIISETASVRDAAIEKTRGSLDVARYLGLDTILLVPGTVDPATPYDAAYRNGLSALKSLAPHAEQTGVSIGVENVWNKFLLSPLETVRFLEEIGSPFVGSYFDVGNVVLTGFPEQWIRLLGSRIKRVHFKDFKRSVGTLAGFCALTEGDVDWPAVLSALEGIGYTNGGLGDGWVTAEFFDCEGDIAQISQGMDTILSKG